MRDILVIHERDHEDGEHFVIGVADSVENAEKLLDEYYGGKFTVIKHTDVRDSGLECNKTLEVLDHKGEPYLVDVWFEWFTINSL